MTEKEEESPCKWTKIGGPETLPKPLTFVHGFTISGKVLQHRILLAASEGCWMIIQHGRIMRLHDYGEETHITHWRPAIHIEPPKKEEGCLWTKIEGVKTLPDVLVFVHGFTRTGKVLHYRIFLEFREGYWQMERPKETLRLKDYSEETQITHWRPAINIEPPKDAKRSQNE
jgi:hypothetical protein